MSADVHIERVRSRVGLDTLRMRAQALDKTVATVSESAATMLALSIHIWFKQPDYAQAFDMVCLIALMFIRLPKYTAGIALCDLCSQLARRN